MEILVHSDTNRATAETLGKRILRKLQQSDHIVQRQIQVRIEITVLRRGEKATSLIRRASSKSFYLSGATTMHQGPAQSP